MLLHCRSTILGILHTMRKRLWRCPLDTHCHHHETFRCACTSYGVHMRSSQDSAASIPLRFGVMTLATTAGRAVICIEHLFGIIGDSLTTISHPELTG